MTALADPATVLLERFDSRVTRTDSCWLWTGASNGKYGQIRVGSKLMYVHRFAYERWCGPISGDLTIDHLCRNKLCVNPEHLEAVTRVENAKRVPVLVECRNGHPYVDGSFYVTKGGTRSCKACRRAVDRRWREKWRITASRFCTVDGCTAPHKARGLCECHYGQTWRASHSEEVKAA